MQLLESQVKVEKIEVSMDSVTAFSVKKLLSRVIGIGRCRVSHTVFSISDMVFHTTHSYR
jgi:hypothetical protein